jgi:hypothetical protein
VAGPQRHALTLPLAVAAVCALPPLTTAQAQTTRHWITETTVTWGRGRFAYQGFGTDAVTLADLGLRWSNPAGEGWGLSFVGGYDFPSEAALIGGRARITSSSDGKRWEWSVALLVSSLDDGYLGGTLGLAYYPRPWGALVVQLDVMPTRAGETGESVYVYDQYGRFAGEDRATGGIEREPRLSYGIRLAERPAAASWVTTGVFGLLAVVFAGELGCC